MDIYTRYRHIMTHCAPIRYYLHGQPVLGIVNLMYEVELIDRPTIVVPYMRHGSDLRLSGSKQ
jgi:hypothetical protein